MKDAGPAALIISKGPRYLSVSLREGCIVQINSARRKTLSLQQWCGHLHGKCRGLCTLLRDCKIFAEAGVDVREVGD